MGRAIALQRQLDAQMQENIAPALAHPGIQYIALREKVCYDAGSDSRVEKSL
jgi:hypothetical protein